MRVAESSIWASAPKSTGLDKIPQLLRQDLGMPEWVLRNLVSGDCFITGNDIRDFHDVVVLTRMSRIGCALQWATRFVPEIKRDSAGGLALRKLDNPDVYFAVRGRILVLSPSREAITRALTLAPKDALPVDVLAREAEQSGQSDLSGVVEFSETDPMGDVFSNLEFTLSVDPTAVRAQSRGTLRDAWIERGGDLLAGLSPKQLLKPPDGWCQVSGDFGKPLRDVLFFLARNIPQLQPLEAQWQQWESLPLTADNAASSIAPVLARVLGPSGPGWTLSLVGADMNEIFPVPLLAGTFGAEQMTDESLAALLPPLPPAAKPWDSIPRFDQERKVMLVPMIGGPSMQPTFGLRDKLLVASSSQTVAEGLLASPETAKTLQDAGNLYMRITPLPIVQTVDKLATMLGQYDLLKGETPESAREKLKQWATTAEKIQDISVLLGCEGARLMVDFGMSCKP
jgi:hypothetical protein